MAYNLLCRLWLCFSSAAALPSLCRRSAPALPSALPPLCPLSAFALPVAVVVLFVLLPFYALLVINILFDVLRKVRQICTASKLLFFYRICNCRKRERSICENFLCHHRQQLSQPCACVRVSVVCFDRSYCVWHTIHNEAHTQEHSVLITRTHTNTNVALSKSCGSITQAADRGRVGEG